MDKATLVNLDIDTGSRVIEALDSAHLKVNVALWITSPDYEDWRLVLSSTALDQSHPLRAYEMVSEILQGKFLYTRPPILILTIKDPFVKELRRMFGKAKSVLGMRLGGQTVGNRFISDAYVYRIH